MADEAVVLRAANMPARQVRTGQGFYVGFGIFRHSSELRGVRTFAHRSVPAIRAAHDAAAGARCDRARMAAAVCDPGVARGAGKSRPSSPSGLGGPVIAALLLTPLVFESLLHLRGTLVGRVPLSRGALFIGWLIAVVAVHFIPAVHDKLTRGQIHPASIWIPLLNIVGFVVLNAVVAPSALGLKVGSWLLK